MIRFIELFAGIGGFRYGLERASEKFTCVWANEIDKYASQIYRKNFGEGELYEGDIRLVPSTEIPAHDLLVGGFPCQSFSIAGKRKGFNDTRGTLFFEIARILRDKRPRCVLLENVKGLLSHGSGKTFQRILAILSDIGYRVEWQVLNSKNFGVPQNRERVFIIGHLRGERGREIFPIPGTYSKADGAVYPCLTPDRVDKRQNGQRFKAKGEPMFTLTGQDKHGIYDGTRIRQLTPTECERLQGFPDGWTEKGIVVKDTTKMNQLQLDILDQRPEWGYEEIEISDTQRYKCLGNAVTTNVITAIGKQIMKRIKID